ncbi:signal recognition particle 14kD protein [Pseudomassariella vexata]|uniref:Signal recognition particle subunit SRP14 n=1 Tax=Pseudomassariella vexata TaxID=1141098 RepID=A0A1Y2E6D4_9PEZI|nr:signal recognition particle 14kD protein [Pseudomassariella vexata]ORY67069.1 signal recognition particle 14kD protein [Pseudomassariella vexata]
MGVLSNDEFFAKLGELLEGCKGKSRGSIFLTQKRLSYEQDIPEPTSENVLPDLHPPRPLPVLIRATNGKAGDKRKERVKLSTIVEPHAIPEFFTKYADVCKMGMAALKPRDRSKRKTKGKKKKTTLVLAS